MVWLLVVQLFYGIVGGVVVDNVGVERNLEGGGVLCMFCMLGELGFIS